MVGSGSGDLQWIANELKSRPAKVLGLATPSERPSAQVSTSRIEILQRSLRPTPRLEGTDGGGGTTSSTCPCLLIGEFTQLDQGQDRNSRSGYTSPDERIGVDAISNRANLVSAISEY